MHLLNHWPYQLQTLQVHRAHNVEGNDSCDLDPSFRSNQLLLVNAFPPKPLDIATSNCADALVRSKAGICNSVRSSSMVK